MTLRYVYDQDAAVARFVAQLIPHIDRGFPSDAKAIGIADATWRALGGMVFYHWNKVAGTTEVAIAAVPGVSFWFSRETIYRLYDYAFRTRDCQMVIVRVRADNRRLLRQLDTFGYAFAPIARLYGRDMDGVICTYTAEQWAANRFNRLPAVQHSEAA